MQQLTIYVPDNKIAFFIELASNLGFKMDKKTINTQEQLESVNEIEDRSHLYDEKTLEFLRQSSRDYHSGKVKGYTAEESLKRIREQIKQRAL